MHPDTNPLSGQKSPPCRPLPLIHIGYPKCMSSWLQKHFFHEKYGFSTVLNPMECQLSIINTPPFRYTPATAARLMADHTPQNPELVPVITSEALSGNMYCGGYNSQQLAHRLHALAPDAHILIMIREQKSLIRSLYKSWVLWGMPHSINRILNPLTPELAPQFNLEYICFDGIVEYYIHLFGSNQVLVMPYEALLETPFMALRKIHDFAGATKKTLAAIDTAPVRARVNKGENLSYLYWLRLKNRFLYSSPFNYNGLFAADNDNLMNRLHNSKKQKFPKFASAWLERSFSETVKKQTFGKFAPSNRKLAQITGIDLAGYGYEF